MEMPRWRLEPANGRIRGFLLLTGQRTLFVMGCFAAGIYGVSVVHSSLYQHQASRAFDEALQSRRAPAAALSALMSLSRVEPLTVPDPASDLPPGNWHEWSLKKLRTYKNLLASPAPTALARLQIPTLGFSVMVLEGTDEATLSRGVGHIPGTARPGETGNLGIAGHRDSFFRSLSRISNADEIMLTTADGRLLRYAVDRIDIVEPERVEVLAPTRGRTLTLVTCYPFYFIGSAPLRYIVKANLIDESAPSM